jgi:hypothetical protein
MCRHNSLAASEIIKVYLIRLQRLSQNPQISMPSNLSEPKQIVDLAIEMGKDKSAI